MKYDLILCGGTVVNGLNSKPYCADVCILNGKIAKIDSNVSDSADKIIDVSGKVVSPGFIDIHSHSDACPLVDYIPESKVYQGVTTELCGNCGISILPSTIGTQRYIENYCASELELPMHGLTFDHVHSMREYAQEVAKKPEATNYCMLIGHGTLRGMVMGFEDRAPSEDEMKKMQDILRREMKDGAFGLSLGLGYPPSCYAKAEEFDALARVIKENGGILAVHMRNEGIDIFDSIREMLGVAERTGVHLQISHLKIMHAANWGRGDEVLALIDGARGKGIHVTCDQYPYPASANALTSVLPHWAHSGGLYALMDRVNHPTKELYEAIKANFEAKGGPENILIASTRGTRPDWEGKTVLEISKTEALNPMDTVLEILRECGTEVFITVFAQSQDVVRKFFCRDDIAVASDAFNLSYDPEITKDKLHPRNFGTFPRALEWARDEKLLPLETVIHKMTALPAQMMGLKNRGTLEVGKAADITVFDPSTVQDNSTYTEPIQKPDGIEYVFVRGETVLEHGILTGKKPGCALLFGID